MSNEVQQLEYPFSLKIETTSGQSIAVPIAFLTREQVAIFLQFDFKRLAQEAGMKGARAHVEQAATANYDDVLREVAACLRRSAVKAA